MDVLDLQRVSVVRPVHFVGVGGCSMSGLALTLHQRGYRVTGSDRAESANLAALRRAGVPVHVGHGERVLPTDAGLIVVSGAVPVDTPELVAGRRRGLTVADRAELLAALMALHPVGIAVAGTRGKTTTAALLVQILTAAGLDPGASLGSAVGPVAGNYRVGAGAYFVAEACEYRQAFLRLRPQVAVVLNIADDHSDCFPTLAATRAAFRGFTQRVDPDGLLIVAAAAVGVLAGTVPARRVSFGLDPDAGTGDAGTGTSGGAGGKHCAVHYSARITGWSAGRARLALFVGRRRLGVLAPRLLGEHNAHNVLAAVAVGHQLGLALAEMREAIEAFGGAPRRLQARRTPAGLRVVDDIACHPGEIAATMAAVRRVAAGGRIVVVLRPNSFTRVRDYLHHYAAAFAPGETVVVADIFPGRDTTTHGLHARDLVRALRAAGRDARYLPTGRRLAEQLAVLAAGADTVVTIGPGDTAPADVPALSQPVPEPLEEIL